MASIGVVGGGLAGLCVGYRCAQAGHQVVLLEASSRLGGQLHTELAHGFIVEHGAEGFVAQSAALHELAAELGLSGDIISQKIRDSSAFDGNQLVRLKPGEAGQRLGFQVSPRAFGKGIESMRGGMMQMVEALLKPLRQSSTVKTTQRVQTVVTSSNGLCITTDKANFTVDRLAIAVPAHPAAELLGDLAGPTAHCLSQAVCSSSVTVSLVYEQAQVDCDDETSGFIVGGAAQEAGFRACSYSSNKLAARSPDTRRLVRMFMRPTETQPLSFSEVQWVQRAQKLLGTAVRVTGAPQLSWVHSWQSALPVFDQAHITRVATLEAKLLPNKVVLAGAAFHGAGIDGAVRSANQATEQLLSL